LFLHFQAEFDISATYPHNKKGRLFPPSQLAELTEYWRGGTVAFMLEVESSTDDAFYSVTPQQSCEVFTPIKTTLFQ